MLANQHYLIVLLGYVHVWHYVVPSSSSFAYHSIDIFLVHKSLERLQGNRAIVVDEPGVTRDRLYGRSFWGDQEFMVVDTGGVMTFSKSQADVMEELAITTTIGMDGIPLASREAAVARMPSMIERQATAAIEEASVIIFLVDGQVCSFRPIL